MKSRVSPISRCSRVKRLRIWAWIETSRAETGSSAMMSSAPMASARAMPTRWHWPPESWAPRRPANSRGRPTRSISSATWRASSRGGQRRWTRKHLAQGLGDGEPRVEGGEGILEDHLGPAAEGQQILRRQAQHVLAGEAHLAARGRGEAQDGAAERALAAAALAHQAEGIALLDGEADAVDRAVDPRRAAGNEIAQAAAARDTGPEAPRPRAAPSWGHHRLAQHHLAPADAGGGMGRRRGLGQGIAGPAARLGKIAARMEAAAGGQIGQRRQLALDRGQLLAPRPRRSGASASAPAYRDGAAGGAARPWRPAP